MDVAHCIKRAKEFECAVYRIHHLGNQTEMSFAGSFVNLKRLRSDLLQMGLSGKDEEDELNFVAPIKVAKR